MKIMWFTNILLPQASEILGIQDYPMGGWLHAGAKALELNPDIELVLVCPYRNETHFKKYQSEHASIYITKRIEKKLAKSNLISEIIELENPDIIHVFGTEMFHSLEIIKTARGLGKKVVLNIQGLTHTIAHHYNSNLPTVTRYAMSPRNIIKRDSIFLEKKAFKKQGEREIKSIRNVDYIIGRSTWDKACTTLINSSAKYYSCNEIIRDSFYNLKWDINRVNRYQIFCSQGHYPIKGLHFMLKALSIVREKVPEAKLVVSGYNIISNDLKTRLKRTHYTKYLLHLIKKYNLKGSVDFKGLLNEKEMSNLLLESHVFVSCSTIENESNSLSEARLVGMPNISSYVGGVTDRIKHGEDGLYYQHDAEYMLAYFIMTIFESDEYASKLGMNAQGEALIRNSKKANIEVLLSIYEDIYNN